jgi:phosphoenolpyruvate-protein phosphotransferase/dihydroxyacetone kinase phosphotransfer subunit
MVGLVLVSHSRALAAAVQELVTSMSGSTLPIAIAAGAGPERAELGTDATEILNGINSVMSDEGVLVLLDIGSAILSAETALEFLDEPQRRKVRLCGAPLVEGAIAAGVLAALGASLDEVRREAQKALRRKTEHLDASAEDHHDSQAEETISGDSPLLTATVVVRNPHGLHARPAADLIRLAARFDCEILVRNLTNGKGPASAKSMSALAAIEILQGHEIELAVRGPDAESALAELKSRIEAGLGEALELPNAREAGTEMAVEHAATAGPVPVSPGIAIGALFLWKLVHSEIPVQKVSDTRKEREKLRRAIEAAKAELARDETTLRQSLGKEEAEIFRAQALILEDPELLEASEKAIGDGHQNAAFAWERSYQAAAAAYQGLSDEYLRQRAADVQDIGHRVLEALGIQRRQAPHLPQPGILVADDLTPAQVAGLSRESVVGVICLQGGRTSHAAILLRARGIPAIAKAKPMFDRESVRPVNGTTTAAFDGESGKLWINPSAEELQELQSWKETREQETARVARLSHEPATTTDGHTVKIFANLGHAAEAPDALDNGAEGVGLFRTEFLFLNRDDVPGEEEQFAVLRALKEAMDQRPVVVRTLDIGGDKPVPALSLPSEANPFLGVRAIRLCLERRELLRTHLRAILRAAHDGNFRIMFPMITDLQELQQARAELEAVHAALESEKKAHAWPIPLGIMIEVPSAAVLIEQLASSVDFFSIGTNDLTQYVLAADRGNPGLAHFHDALHPAVLRLISRITRAAHKEGKDVGVCGEAASDPVAATLFIGLGVDELSLAPALIPKIKDSIRRIARTDMEELAGTAQEVATAVEVRALVKQGSQ